MLNISSSKQRLITYYVMIDTPNDVPSNLKYTSKLFVGQAKNIIRQSNKPLLFKVTVSWIPMLSQTEYVICHSKWWIWQLQKFSGILRMCQIAFVTYIPRADFNKTIYWFSCLCFSCWKLWILGARVIKQIMP